MRIGKGDAVNGERFCELQTHIMRSSLATRTISFMTFSEDAASNPDVGSSKKRTVGCLSKAIPTDRRRCCPPDRRWFCVSAQMFNPILVITSFTASST